MFSPKLFGFTYIWYFIIVWHGQRLFWLSVDQLRFLPQSLFPQSSSIASLCVFIGNYIKTKRKQQCDVSKSYWITLCPHPLPAQQGRSSVLQDATEWSSPESKDRLLSTSVTFTPSPQSSIVSLHVRFSYHWWTTGNRTWWTQLYIASSSETTLCDWFLF